MSETTTETVPEGFKQIPTGLGFSDNLQPMYGRIRDGAVSLGLVVSAQHQNSMGVCHGGVLVTLADITAATGVNVARGTRAGTPTVNLSMDFISAARLGEWIQADAQQVTLKRRFGFCNGAIFNSKGLVARFNGTFYLPDHDGLSKSNKVGDGVPPVAGY